jgi:hypothetical protein
VPHAVDDERIDQDFGGCPGAVIGAHGSLRYSRGGLDEA